MLVSAVARDRAVGGMSASAERIYAIDINVGVHGC
jgi:hypothetical protein